MVSGTAQNPFFIGIWQGRRPFRLAGRFRPDTRLTAPAWTVTFRRLVSCCRGPCLSRRRKTSAIAPPISQIRGHPRLTVYGVILVVNYGLVFKDRQASSIRVAGSGHAAKTEVGHGLQINHRDHQDLRAGGNRTGWDVWRERRDGSNLQSFRSRHAFVFHEPIRVFRNVQGRPSFNSAMLTARGCFFVP